MFYLESPPIPADPATFWGQDASSIEDVPPARVPSTPCEVLANAGAFPFWRGQDDFLATMRDAYRDASPVGRDVFLGDSDTRGEEQACTGTERALA